MQIIHVIPFAKGLGRETLSYFSAEPIATGSIVEVPINKRLVSGLVVSCESAAHLKSEIKSASFELKKLSSTKSAPFFLPEFIESAKRAGTYFAATTGAVLSATIPKALTENLSDFPIKHSDRRAQPLHEAFILQTDEDERFGHYKSLIRETFARKGSVFFCLPTIQDIHAVAKKLEKGIEEYTFILHNSLTKKELTQRCKTLLATDHPVLIIATGPFLSLPRKDIGAIIVEKESSRSYKTQQRPHLDVRTFAEYLAKQLRSKIVFGDIFLQTETVHRYQNGEFQELYPIKFRSLTTSESFVADLRRYKTEVPANGIAKKYQIISDELAELVRTNQRNNEHLFVFVARKGLSPTTICGDCGTIVVCRECQSPVVLHSSKNGPFFLCHKCGERRTAEERCINCDSWKLVTLGAGAEKVEEEIRKIAPEAHIFSLNRDTVTTHKRGAKIAAEFYDTPGSILIGTEMALVYLDAPVENSAVASIDSLFSIPDFKISEKVLSILLHIRSCTQKMLLLQTRNPQQPLFGYALKGNILDFYREEIVLRKMFHYPPFSTLLKLSIEGKKDDIVAEMGRTKALFADQEIDVFPSFVKGKNGTSILHALIKVPRAEWPNPKIIQRFQDLSPRWTIKVDPDSLL